MSYYPIVLDWDGMPCLIAGGGKIALHKAEVLCSHGADVTVVAIQVCEELEDLPVRIRRRAVTEDDVPGNLLVVDATGNEEAEMMLSEACRRYRIAFNSACRSDDGTAIFPAVSKSGRTMVAVSTFGASPAASTRIRDALASQIPDGMDMILDVMEELRPLSRKWFETQDVRKQFLTRCLDIMMKEKRPLDPDGVERVRKEISENKGA